MDFLFILKSDLLRRTGNRVGIESFCEVAPDIGSLIRYNWIQYSDLKLLVEAALDKLLLKQLVEIVVGYRCELDVVRV